MGLSATERRKLIAAAVYSAADKVIEPTEALSFIAALIPPDGGRRITRDQLPDLLAAIAAAQPRRGRKPDLSIDVQGLRRELKAAR